VPTWARIRSTPAYPALITLSYVAAAATDLAIPAGWAVRTAIVGLLAVGTLQLMVSLVTRDRLVAGPIALAILFWLAGHPIGVGVVLELLLFAELARRVASLAGRTMSGYYASLTRAANVFGFALVLVTSAGVIPAQLALVAPAAAPSEAPSEPGPDIFLIVLDGYPRADTLATTYGFDNSPFLHELEDRGFEVATRARSNYNMTYLTFASMLSMKHVADIPQLDPSLPKEEQRRRLAQVIANPTLIRVLRDHGYQITMVQSPFPMTAVRSADHYVDTGQLNDFEIGLVVRASQRGPVGRLVADFLADQLRERVRLEFDELRRLAEPAAAPRFVMVHLLTPHPPFVFGPSGENAPVQDCFPAACGLWDGWTSQLRRDDFETAAGDQITYVNSEVLRAVDAILAAATQPPIIILMSDHGSRLDPDDPDEMHRILFATLTPGQAGLFEDDATPISVFPRLLRAYLGVYVAEPPPLEFQWDMRIEGDPLDLTPYSPTDDR